jgi:glucosylceramidase
MREQYVDCYAEYIVKFIKSYEKHGIKVSAITPQNEPEAQQEGRYPTCIWHPETEAKFIKILSARFKEKGLDVKIWMFDHDFNGVDRVHWSLENDRALVESVDGAAFHYYQGEPEQTKIIAQKFPQIELHFTEGGPRLYDHYDSDWCKWSIMIARALRCGYRSFTGWNLLLNETGGPNIGPFFCGGLVTANRVTGGLEYSGQYKAFSHIAPYLTESCKVYALNEEEEHAGGLFGYPNSLKKKIEGVAIVDGERLVAVLINPNDDKEQAQISWKGERWYVELLGDSVSTLIIE